jgi:hypothetical protein
MAALPLIVFDVCETTSRSCNDGAHLAAHLWRQKRDGRGPLHRRHECVWLLRSIHDIGAAVMKMQADTTRPSCPSSPPKGFDGC